MLKASLSAALALAAVVAGPAMAHPHHGGGAMLHRADADGDGTITRDEYRSARERLFARLDRNSDGYIDDADDGQAPAMKRHRGAVRAAAMRKALDADNDDRISRAELVDVAMSRFDRSDSDGNGVLDAKEIEASRAAAKQRMRELREQRAPKAQ